MKYRTRTYYTDAQKKADARLTFDMSVDRRQAQPAGGRPLDGGVRPHAAQSHLHHCCSQGMPSLLPSILTLGQCLRK